MKTILLLMSLVFLWESTDPFCMMDCREKGYTYGYCKRFCSY